MKSPSKKRTTYRLSSELDLLINQHAAKLGISKNAFVQMTLMTILDNPNTGNEELNKTESDHPVQINT
jgi:uncharacterized protein (DUF1778 family)